MLQRLRARREKIDLRRTPTGEPSEVTTANVTLGKLLRDFCAIVRVGEESLKSVTLIGGTSATITSAKKTLRTNAAIAVGTLCSATRNNVAAIPATVTIDATRAATIPMTEAKLR